MGRKCAVKGPKLASTVSALALFDSTGAEWDLTLAYDASAKTLTVAVTGATGGWWISSYHSSGFFDAIQYDSAADGQLTRNNPTTTALTVCRGGASADESSDSTGGAAANIVLGAVIAALAVGAGIAFLYRRHAANKRDDEKAAAMTGVMLDIGNGQARRAGAGMELVSGTTAENPVHGVL